MRLVLGLVVIGWLPGAALFRAPFLHREKRAALPAEERLYWQVVLSVTLSIAIVLSLAAVHRYSFGRLLATDVAVAALVAFGSRFDLALGSAARRPTASALVPIALIVLAVWRLFPPSEYIIGGKDPGVYVSEGIQIAQRGAILVHDPVIASVPPFARDLFFPADANLTHYLAVRFMGFYVVDPDSGAVIGQFPHLFPASIAIGYGLAGLSGARETICVWALLGVLAVYFLAARLVGRAAAATAAVLLTLNVIEVWFARYPNAEIVMQALVFAALLATARGQVEDDPFFSGVAGALLGLLLFLRFDAALAVGAALLGVAFGYVAGRRVRWTFGAPLSAAILLAAWYYLGPMRDYVHLPIFFLVHLPTWQLAALGAAASVIGVLLVGGWRWIALSSRLVRFLPAALTIAVVVLAVYGLWFRHPGGKLTDYDAYALRTFAAFYFTLPALIAALIGFALVIRPRFWEDPAFALTLTAYALLFFYKIRIVPEHFWAARRFLPVILPGALLCVSAAALTGVRGRGLLSRSVRVPIGIVFLALVALSYVRAARPVLGHIEYEGIIARLEALAGRIGDRDLLVVESRDAGSDVHVFGLPLAYIYGRNVLTLSNAKPDKVIFASFLNRMHARYDRVLFLGGGGTDLLFSRWSVTPIKSERFQIPEYDSPRNAYPRFVRHKEFDYSLYVFGPPPATPPPPVLDVGVNDDLNVNRFHAKEETEGRTFRWSQRQSVLIVNHIDPGNRTIALWMSNGGRPAAAAPADVTVLLNDVTLGTVHVENGFREYDVAIPPAVAAAASATGEPVRIMLRTPTWNPMRTLGTDDNRDLGVMVDRVGVR